MNDDEKILQQRALNLSYRYLSYRPRTVKETYNYLHKKAKEKPRYYSFDEKIIDKTIEELLELKLLDDKAFVEWFLRYRTQLKPKGVYVLKLELKKYGVSQELVNNYFDTNTVDEEGLARQVLERRMGQFKGLPYLEKRKKMQDFLLRRGFSYETIRKAINEIDKAT